MIHRSYRFVPIVLTVAAAGAAQANIGIDYFFQQSVAFAQNYDSPTTSWNVMHAFNTGYVTSASTFYDPSVGESYIGSNAAQGVYGTTNVVHSTLNNYEVAGNFDTYAAASNDSSTNYVEAGSTNTLQVDFTLDAPAWLTFTLTGPGFQNYSTGSGESGLQLNIDYHGWYSYNITSPISIYETAGSHYFYIEDSAFAYAGGGFDSYGRPFSYGPSGSAGDNLPFDLRIQSVPEPTTLAILGCAVASLLKRRRKG